MGCNKCGCQIGHLYRLEFSKCVSCGLTVYSILAEYIGMKDGWHGFRNHPQLMCECGEPLRYTWCKCTYNVTEEFQLLQNTKDSHWVGK